MDELRHLELTLRRRVAGATSGDREGLGLGPGSSTEELVRYQPEHDVRLIDWNVTARAGEPYVWLTRAEHALETWVLVDQSPSMAFGTVEWEKADVANWVAAAFGLLSRNAGDSVGLGLVSPLGVRWIRPGSGRISAHRMLTANDMQRDGTGPYTLVQALSRLNQQAPRAGLRVIVSDFLDPTGSAETPFSWEKPLRALTARHDVIVVEVIDPRELELPDVGEVILQDPESGRQREVPTSDHRLRRAYAIAATSFRTATASAIRSSGAGHLVLRTDDDLARSLSRFIHRRRREPVRPSRSTR